MEWVAANLSVAEVEDDEDDDEDVSAAAPHAGVPTAPPTMTPHDYGLHVLGVLAVNEEWNSEVLDLIAGPAFDSKLAYSDEETGNEFELHPDIASIAVFADGSRYLDLKADE